MSDQGPGKLTHLRADPPVAPIEPLLRLTRLVSDQQLIGLVVEGDQADVGVTHRTPYGLPRRVPRTAL